MRDKHKQVTRVIATALSATLLAATFAGCGALEKAKSKFGGIGRASENNNGIGRASENNKHDEGPDSARPPQTSPLGLTGNLQSFASCAEVEAYVKARATEDMNRAIDQQIYWINREERYAGSQAKAANDDVSEHAASNAASDSAGGAEGAAQKNAPSDHSTTNNQVEGVEEGDIVKTDGTHVFHIAQGKLQILQSWPAASLAKVAELKLAGRPFALLLDEDAQGAAKRLVILMNPPATLATQQGSAKVGSAIAVDAAPGVYGAMRFDFEQVKIAVVDVADPAKPAVTASYLMNGSYADARRVGSSVRIILRSYRSYPEGVYTYYPYDPARPMPSREERLADLEQIRAKNEKLIAAAGLDFWLQLVSFGRLDDKGTVQPTVDLGNCSNVHAPTTSAEGGLTRVATLALDSGKISETVLLTHAGEVYASKTALYVTTPYWWWNEASKDTDYTYVHKFDLTAPDKAAYLGSGGVEGRVLNQFAMDEYQDYLRLAVTVSRVVRSDSNSEVWRAPQTVNRVSVLAPVDGALKLVGQTEDLAPGESIYSARFHGPKGFVVTFRRVDPLYTLDLSNPVAPKVVGALKIPGYSSYIHMLDDQHLLTVGREGEETGRITGLKVAIYDVSDMAKPKETHKLVVPGNYWSEAEWSHKAFTYFPARKLLAIPVAGYGEYLGGAYDWWRRYKSSLLVFKVDAAAGVNAAGEVDMSDIYVAKQRDESWWFSGTRVERSIFADDYVYAVSNLGVKAMHVEPSTGKIDGPTVGTVRYDCNDECYSGWWYWR